MNTHSAEKEIAKHRTAIISTRPELKIPRNEIFPTACRILVWPFVVVVKARQRAAP